MGTIERSLIDFLPEMHLTKIIIDMRLLGTILGITLFLLNTISCNQISADNTEDEDIKMITEFYRSHNNIWSADPILPYEAFDRKLDSLNLIYCTPELAKEAKEYLEMGHDLITNDFGIGNESLNSLSIKKDSTKENTFRITYLVSNEDASGKSIIQKVNFQLSLRKDADNSKIKKIW